MIGSQHDRINELHQQAEQGNYTALQTLLLAAEMDDKNAQYTLGRMYNEGRGVPHDDQQAVTWYRRAAEHGHADAQYTLGNLLIEGRVVRYDKYQAVAWYRRAAEQGHADAQYILGDLLIKRASSINHHLDCIGGPVLLSEDLSTQERASMYKEATKLFMKAAEQGQPDAQFKVAEMYIQGPDIGDNISKGLKLLHNAAKGGSCQAQFRLGLMYKDGEYVHKDKKKAVNWLRNAAEQGNTMYSQSAKYELKLLKRRGFFWGLFWCLITLGIILLFKWLA